MAFDFPASPTVGAIYSPAGGPSWQWDGAKWIQVTGSTSPPVPLTAESRNRIVNPAMQISQENGNTGSASMSSLDFHSADQWRSLSAVSPGTVNAQRVQGATPNGSLNRSRIVVAVAKAALAAGDYLVFRQPLEGIRVADFGWGAAGAKQVILRFGFKGPAGTYSASLFNSALNRTYLANFTIAAGQANTDTTQTLVIPGDTTGAWLTDTGVGIYLNIVLATGSTYQGVAGWQAGLSFGTPSNSNGMATAGNVFELFDVGLYLDRNNTGLPPPWQMPDEAAELIACQRYWQQTGVFYNATVTNAVAYYVLGYLPVVPRTQSATLSGANLSGTSFPAAVGTLVQGYAPNIVREGRVANASAAGNFSSTITCNARM
jgi:hypothetical protein